MDRTDGSHWFYSYLPQGVAGGATSALIPLFAYALGGTLFAARTREPHRSDWLGRRLGPRGRMARHWSGIARRGDLVDARALRDWRGAWPSLGAPRSGVDSRTGGPGGSPGGPRRRCSCSDRA